MAALTRGMPPTRRPGSVCTDQFQSRPHNRSWRNRTVRAGTAFCRIKPPRRALCRVLRKACRDSRNLETTQVGANTKFPKVRCLSCTRGSSARIGEADRSAIKLHDDPRRAFRTFYAIESLNIDRLASAGLQTWILPSWDVALQQAGLPLDPILPPRQPARPCRETYFARLPNGSVDSIAHSWIWA